MLLVSRYLVLSAYFSLLTLILLWHIWLAPPARFPVALALIIFAIPLLFPLRGLLYGRRYTHAWTSMLSLFYFAIGVMEAYSMPALRLYASMQIMFSLGLFVGCIAYIRLTKKQRLKIIAIHNRFHERNC